MAAAKNLDQLDPVRRAGYEEQVESLTLDEQLDIRALEPAED
jgi:hypothetical protein